MSKDTLLTPSPAGDGAPAGGGGASGQPPAPKETPAPPAAPAAPAGGAPAAAPKPGEEGQPPAPADDKNKAPEGAPKDGYADFKLPEGMELIPEVAGEFKALAKEMNLTQEAAQKLVDLQAKSVAQAQQASEEGFEKMKGDWRSESLRMLGADKEVQLAFAAKALDNEKFGPKEKRDELRALFSETGLGDHPAMVSFLVAVGKAISEDNPPPGRPGEINEKSLAARFHGK